MSKPAMVFQKSEAGRDLGAREVLGGVADGGVDESAEHDAQHDLIDDRPQLRIAEERDLRSPR